MTTALKFLVLIMMVPAFAIAQTQGEDIIELKNGELHRGVVVEQYPGQLIRLLQLPSGDTLTITVAEIKVMRKVVTSDEDQQVVKDSTSIADTTVSPDTSVVEENNPFNQEPIHVGLYYSVGGGDWSSQGLGLNLYYRLLPRLEVGVGVEFRGDLNDFNNPINYIFPLTASARYELKQMWNKRGALLFDTHLGYHVMEGSYLVGASYAELQNGFYLTSGLGLRINVTRETGFIFSAGYQFIQTRAALNDAIINQHNYSSAIVKASFFF